MEDFFEYKVWFSTVNISNKKKFILLDNMENEKHIYENRKFLSRKNKYLKNLDVDMQNEEVENIIENIDKNKYKFTTFSENNYPNTLKDIHDKPYSLFYKGNIDELNNKISLAIVGSRNCTSYGREIAKNIAFELGKRNINIVSGGALGIDTVAHDICNKNNFYNTAILGCGIDICYPSYNKGLYNNIEKNGVIITEYIPKTPPYRYNFPKRNRIISGISKAVIVVEASSRSGALITCSQAIEQGKDVVAVPGNVFSSQSIGCNKLINDGAYLFTNIDDMLYNLSIDCNYKNNCECNGLEKLILDKLTGKIMNIDELIRLVDVDTSVIHELLCELQFENKIINIYGNCYTKIL